MHAAPVAFGSRPPLSNPRIVQGDRGYDHDKYRHPLHAAGIATEIARGASLTAAGWEKRVGLWSEPARGYTTSDDCESLRTPCIDPRSLHEDRLLHHLLAKTEGLDFVSAC